MKNLAFLAIFLFISGCKTLGIPAAAAVIKPAEAPKHHICNPLQIMPVHTVPYHVESALREAIIYWTAHVGVIPFLQVTSQDILNFEATLDMNPPKIRILVIRDHFPPIATHIKTDKDGCVLEADIILSNEMIEGDWGVLKGAFGHELGQILGLEEPMALSSKDVAWLRRHTAGFNYELWGGVPTYGDYIKLLIHFLREKQRQEQMPGEPSP